MTSLSSWNLVFGVEGPKRSKLYTGVDESLRVALERMEYKADEHEQEWWEGKTGGGAGGAGRAVRAEASGGVAAIGSGVMVVGKEIDSCGGTVLEQMTPSLVYPETYTADLFRSSNET